MELQQTWIDVFNPLRSRRLCDILVYNRISEKQCITTNKPKVVITLMCTW